MLLSLLAASTAYLLTPPLQRCAVPPRAGCCARFAAPVRAALAAPSAEDQASGLSAWLEGEGLLQTDTPVRPEALEGWGLCLTASAAIAEGDKLLAVPRRQHLTKSAAAEAFGAAATEKIDEVLGGDESGTLALLLLVELAKGEGSRWAPYLRGLPRTLDLPLLWSDAERETLLKGSHLLEATRTSRALLHAQWQALSAGIFPQLREHFSEAAFPAVASAELSDLDEVAADAAFGETPPFSALDYVWAHAIVLSRALPFGDELALIPFLDLANHETDSPNQCSISMDSGGQAPVAEAWQLEQLQGEPYAVLIAGKTVEEGEQVFIDYGEAGMRSSWEMLVTYGFVNGESPSDWLPAGGRPLFFDGVSPDDPLRPQKTALLVALGAEEEGVFGSWLDVKAEPEQLVRVAPLLRLAHLDASSSPERAATLEAWGAEPQEFWQALQSPLAPANELRVAAQVKAACEAALSELPSTDELAEAARPPPKGQGGAASRATLAARVLLGERYALEAAVDFWGKAAEGAKTAAAADKAE